MELNIKQKVIIGLLAASVMMGLARYFFYDSTVDFVNASLEVQRRQRIVNELQTLLTLLVDAETGERGYIITREDRFLEPYQEARKKIDAQFTSLQAAMPDTGYYESQLDTLRNLMNAQLSTLDQNIRLVQSANYQEAVQQVTSGQGKPLLDAIRSKIAALVGQENAYLRLLAMEVESERRVNNWTNVVSLITLVVIFGIGGSTILRDVDRLQQLETALSQANVKLQAANSELQYRLSQLFEAQRIAKIGSFVSNYTSHTFHGTPEFYRIFGWKESEADQTDSIHLFYDAVHPEDRQQVQSVVNEAISHQKPYQLEYRIILPDHSQKTVLDRGHIFTDAQTAQLFIRGAVLDITERKQYENQLHELNQQLQSGIEELHATNEELNSTVEELSTAQEKISEYSLVLEQKNEELQLINEQLNRVNVEMQSKNAELEAFSYSISHDLRSPLRAIIGFCQFLMEDYASCLDAEGYRLVKIISENSLRLGQMVDDLLEFARLGKQAVHKSRFPMEKVVQAALNELSNTHDQVPKVHIASLPEVNADFALLKHVWVNLLSNAIKFSSRTENPYIEIGSGIQEGEQVFYIRDTGVGFDQAYNENLFGVFRRLHTREEFPGTGVGLAIVARIVGNHGGKVWAEGAINKGATFYFTLPQQA